MQYPEKTSSYKIETFEIIPEKYASQLAALMEICFGGDPTQTPEEKAEQKDRFYSRAFKYILAIENHQVVGAISLVQRQVEYQGREINLGGIGGVGTLPEKRGRGVAKNMVDKAVIELTKKNCDIAFLCTNLDGPGRSRLYENVGFQKLNKPYRYIGRSGKKYLEEDGMVIPIKSKEIFQQVLDGNEVFFIGQGNW